MSKNSQEIVYEGWLTKSPPTKRIWRARWRRRWFLLTHSGELPGQYVLTYYTDRNCRKLKGIIDLDRCEQVDLGLRLDERKLKFDHVFDIKTPSRTYYLAADTEDEMKSWVTCICKVCGLKATNEEDEVQVSAHNLADIEVSEDNADQQPLSTFQDSPPVSPVSTSPYIPISECITGKSPIFDPKDFKTLLEYNRKSSLLQTHTNANYELHRNYLNCERDYENDISDPRFYDFPRQLVPARNEADGETEDKNHSPLQSPTDSDSVFNDEEWPPVHTSSDMNTSKKSRPSDSSADVDIIATQKFTKVPLEQEITSPIVPPPRPPKPSHVVPGPCYLNLTPSKNRDSDIAPPKTPITKESQRIITDEMYDFPRSHHVECESTKGTLRRHCYNNAAPVNCSEGIIFRYDISPKPSTSSTVFRYDIDCNQDVEPTSPAHSHSSSTAAYSNLPSPLLTESQLMPPPVVNRDLKPKRKLSDSHSINSNPEPPSPMNAPSVDRKLKPPTPLQEAHMRKSFNMCENEPRRIRAAPSPTPSNLGRSHESLLLQNHNDAKLAYQYLPGQMQYLDLDLEGSSNTYGSTTSKSTQKHQGSDTVYKEVDFMKTQAFNNTRLILEKERQEPVTFVKK